MKTRIFSAFIALLIVIPIIIIGGNLYKLGVYILAIICLKEFMDMKEIRKKIPLFIKYISYIILTLLIFVNYKNNLDFTIDYRIISGLFLVYLIPTVLYHNSSKYSINDAFYLMGGIFFLGVSFHLLILIRDIDIQLLIYLILITTISDIFAYFTGFLIGKNKLLEAISPKKTWEGLIGGTIMGVLISSIFYLNIINPSIELHILIIATLFLSLLGQLGDLVFSSIKRYYGKKDFSNIMPGHGGILDRLDSIIFVVIGYMFFITIL